MTLLHSPALEESSQVVWSMIYDGSEKKFEGELWDAHSRLSTQRVIVICLSSLTDFSEGNVITSSRNEGGHLDTQPACDMAPS